MENISTTNVQKKVVSRVVLVSDQGQRILDTLVEPQGLSEDEQMVTREGLKTELMKLGEQKGPSLEVVRELITDIITDKKVVGYHLPNKLHDLGIMQRFKTNGLLLTNMHDSAKIFNRDPNLQLQLPIGQLCQNELNLAYSKRAYPYLFSEAKICMALYLRWQDLKTGGNGATEQEKFLNEQNSENKENENHENFKNAQDELEEKLKSQIEDKT